MKRNCLYLWLTVCASLHLTMPAKSQVWSSVTGGVVIDSLRVDGNGDSIGMAKIHALEVFNGKLYAAGWALRQDYYDISNYFYRNIARWDGVQWDTLPVKNGSTDTPFDFTSLKTYGDKLYVGGYKTNAYPFKGFDIWNDTSWMYNGIGISTGNIEDIEVYGNEVYAAGYFPAIGGIPAKNIGSWDGSNWTEPGGGLTDGSWGVNALEIYKGELYAGGAFNTAGNIPAFYIARWDGTQWDSVGTGLWDKVWDMAVDTINDYLYVGGLFETADDTITANYVARWDGNQWSGLPGSDILTDGFSIGFYRGELYVGSQGGYGYNGLARWDGNQWHPVLPVQGMKWARVDAIKEFKNELYLSGYFQFDNNTTIHIIKWYLPENCNHYPTALFSLDTNVVSKFDSITITNKSIVTPGDTIVSWFWDYGDSTMDSIPNPGYHTYSDTGIYNLELKIQNMDGCTSRYEKTITVVEPQGMEAGDTEEKQLIIYPNPAGSSFTVEASEGTSVKVTTITGKLIIEEELTGHKVVIKTDNWPKGTYICVLLKDGKQVGESKMVVE